MKTDIEIAQEAKLQPILQIAQKAGLRSEERRVGKECRL